MKEHYFKRKDYSSYKNKMNIVIFGIISGIITGLGMGGGTILILLLSSFLGIDQHVAQATNLIFFVPTSISAIIINIKHKNIKFNTALIVILFGIIGAVFGSLISNKLPSRDLKKCFTIFILIIAIHEFYDLYKEYRNKRKKT